MNLNLERGEGGSSPVVLHEIFTNIAIVVIPSIRGMIQKVVAYMLRFAFPAIFFSISIRNLTIDLREWLAIWTRVGGCFGLDRLLLCHA